jgi:hypothetical protein
MSLTSYNKLETIRRLNILINHTPHFFVKLKKYIKNDEEFNLYYRVLVENYEYEIIPNLCVVSFFGIYPRMRHLMSQIRYIINNDNQLLTITFNYDSKSDKKIEWIKIIFNYLKIPMWHTDYRLVATLISPILNNKNLFWPFLYRYTDAGVIYSPLNYLLNIPNINIYMSNQEIIDYLIKKEYVVIDHDMASKWLSKIKGNLVWNRIRPYYFIYHIMKGGKITPNFFWTKFIRLDISLIIKIFNYL